MGNLIHNKKPADTIVRKQVSNLLGILNGQVIASSPNGIKEISSVSLETKKKKFLNKIIFEVVL